MAYEYDLFGGYDDGSEMTVQDLYNYIQRLKWDSEDLKEGSVTEGKIADFSVTNAKIANASIGQAHIRDASITNAMIQNLAVSRAKIQEAAIGSAQIDYAAITSAHIDVAAIQTAHIDDAAITSAKIEDASITTAKIEDAAIDKAKIKEAAIIRAHISEGSIDTARIANAAITAAKIQDAEITSAKIRDAAITTAKIEAGAITTALISEGAIEEAQIADASITDAKIVDLTANKITAGTIDTTEITIQGLDGHLALKGNRLQVFDNQTVPVERVSIGDVNANGSVYGFRVRGADGTTVLYDETGVYNEGITDGAITNPKIGDGEIDNRVIRANTITGDRLIADSITGREVKAESITANHLVSNTITASSGVIADAAITNAMIGEIDAGKITTGVLDAGRIRVGVDSVFDEGYDPTLIQPGGGNLLLNSNFTDGMTHYSTWNDITTEFVQDEIYGNVIHITTTSSSNFLKNDLGTYINGELLVGDEVTLSFMAKGNCRVGGLRLGNSGSGAYQITNTGALDIDSTGWKKYTVTLTVNTDSRTVDDTWGLRMGFDGECHIANLMLVKGNVDMPWMLNIAEVEDNAKSRAVAESKEYAEKGEHYSVSIPTDGGWYRIATNGGDRATARFIITDKTNGHHSTAEFIASVNYGNHPIIDLLHFSKYGSAEVIEKIRMSTGGTYDPVYLDVKTLEGSSRPSFNLDLHVYENIQDSGWSIVPFEPASAIPSTYDSTELLVNLENSTSGRMRLWEYPDTTEIDGGSIRTNTIQARHIDVATLDAISADIGHIEAGTIEGVEIYGTYIEGSTYFSEAINNNVISQLKLENGVLTSTQTFTTVDTVTSMRLSDASLSFETNDYFNSFYDYGGFNIYETLYTDNYFSISGFSTAGDPRFEISAGIKLNIETPLVYFNADAEFNDIFDYKIKYKRHDFLNLRNGWTNYGGSFQSARYTKMADNMVYLAGLVRDGANGDDIAILPSGCRPNQTEMFSAASTSGNPARIYIYSTGRIVAFDSVTYVSLSGICFLAEN